MTLALTTAFLFIYRFIFNLLQFYTWSKPERIVNLVSGIFWIHALCMLTFPKILKSSPLIPQFPDVDVVLAVFRDA